MKYVPKPLEGNVNVSQGRQHILTELLLLCGALLALTLGAYYVLGLAVDWVAPYVPRELEEKIAEKFDVLPTVETRHADYLQHLAEVLAKNAPKDAGSLIVRVMDSEEVNAFAFPGGRIYLTRGLLEAATSENEVAMIVGHEMGHLANRDHLKAFGRGLVLALVASFIVKADDAVQYFIGPSLSLGHLSYSRQQEEQADLHSLTALVAHYGHGGGATDFFRRMAASKGDELPPPLLSTHPMPLKRIGVLEERLANLGLGEDGDFTHLPEWWEQWQTQ